MENEELIQDDRTLTYDELQEELNKATAFDIVGADRDKLTVENVIMEMVKEFVPKTAIINFLMNKFGYSNRYANMKYNAVLKQYIQTDDFAAYKATNVCRLEETLFQLRLGNKHTDMLKAIDMLNKMMGCYTPTEVKVAQETVVVF